MNTHFNNSDNFTELVFENKNKNYGAYALRVSQNETLFKAMFFSALLFTSITILAILFSNTVDKIPFTGGNTTSVIDPGITVVIDPPVVPEKIIKKKLVEIAPKTFSGQMKASDDPKDAIDKSNEEMNISKNPNPLGSDSAVVSTEIPVENIPVENNNIEKVPDKMPELDGLYQFISSHLKYPAQAVDAGIEGTVYISFVVEKDGSVTDVKTVRGIGVGCEQEAIRVVKMLPKWQSGVKGGKPVRVQCNLPVKFKLRN